MKAKPRILVYCPLSPRRPRIFARTMQSILTMSWDMRIEMMFDRDDSGEARDLQQVYDNITDKYNRARELALTGKFDALLTVESDMILPAITLERLTRIEADVAYGLYCSRHGKHDWLAATFLDKRSARFISEDAALARAAWGQVVETVGVGMGCTLIWRHVLEAIPFRREEGFGANDWFFSLDCQEQKFVQKTDLGVVCGHINNNLSPRVYWPDPQAEKLYSLGFFDGAQLVKAA